MKRNLMLWMAMGLLLACGADKPVREGTLQGPGWDAKAGELRNRNPRTLIVAATHLRVKQSDLRTHPTFARVVQPITRELETSPGLVGYATRATWDLSDEWTVSIWESEEDMMRFAASDVHLDGVEAMQRLGSQAWVGHWPVNSSEVPWSWDKVLQQLDGQGRDGFGDRRYPRP